MKAQIRILKEHIEIQTQENVAPRTPRVASPSEATGAALPSPASSPHSLQPLPSADMAGRLLVWCCTWPAVAASLLLPMQIPAQAA